MLAASFAAPLLALDFAQLDYKGQLDNRGMTAGRQRLIVSLTT
ncbi:hypothetical protein [Mesorhizobium sp. WSM2561]|nr:hypothetical protein [Mesorhizobium sp. WSM2561]